MPLLPTKMEAYAQHPDGVKMPDGSYRLKHKDKFETFQEREAREAHNTYVRFSRTFESS